MNKITKEKFNKEADRIADQANKFQFTRAHIIIIAVALTIVAVVIIKAVV